MNNRFLRILNEFFRGRLRLAGSEVIWFANGPYAENVKQLSPGSAEATTVAKAQPWVTVGNRKGGREVDHFSVGPSPRPQQAAAWFGLGSAAIARTPFFSAEEMAAM